MLRSIRIAAVAAAGVLAVSIVAAQADQPAVGDIEGQAIHQVADPVAVPATDGSGPVPKPCCRGETLPGGFGVLPSLDMTSQAK
jgi:hypothetical protein